MKKLYFLLIAVLALGLTACDENPSAETIIEDENVSYNEIHILQDRENSSSRAVAMQKPSIDEMENFDAITNGYIQGWEYKYTITDDDVKILKGCLSEPRNKDNAKILGGLEHSYYSKDITESDLVSGNEIILTGTYKFDDSKLNLSEDEKNVLSEKGWTIVSADNFENLNPISYEKDMSEYNVGSRYNEERAQLYKKIGGNIQEFERNPANTILITNDLLLHSFHKLFDNTLKYYEQTISRDIIRDLSQDMFDKFTKLAKEETDSDLKETYEFLSAYWSIPAILLVDKEDFEIVPHYDEEVGYWVEGTTKDDEEMQNIIKEKSKVYLAQLHPTYQKLVSTILNQIFAANETIPDPFLSSYSPDFILLNDIKQDYTQFAPRSHYTDNAELKTYFMAMKWLMREKFYFGDNKLMNAALIMVNNISDEEVEELSSLSTKIKKLVGGDDDLTLDSLTNWMKENNVNSIEAIENITEEQKEELFRLVPQKIQSTAYSTEDTMSISSDEAKDMTAGFVFFGEKFTLDSYLFDLVTAGSAEFEYEYMPNKQTALIVPEILEDNSDAAEMVNLWMSARIAKGDVLENSEFTQYSSYNKVKKDVKEKIQKELNESTIINTIYHKWIDMLGYLINKPENNAPYFKLDPIYRLKNLVTYMGSYTELKHDTLLYVKQAYAEMGGGGLGCAIEINPPALPVPKGYIEADLDVIDKLISLNNETKNDFNDMPNYVLNNFIEFDNFLNHTKKILQQQMQNEIISDEDFEWMRTAYDQLSAIIYPFSESVSLKEMRAALIADIFTSEGGNPLYEAVGRPAIMLVMIDDINGKRIAMGPVFTHYEFYDSDNVLDAKGSRLNDIQWQDAYDSLTGNQLKAALSTLSKNLNKGLKPQE